MPRSWACDIYNFRFKNNNKNGKERKKKNKIETRKERN